MKCPFCGKEMDEGFVLGASGSPVLCNTFLYWNDSEHKAGWLSMGLKLSADHHNLGSPAVAAHKCDDCKKIIMDTYIVDKNKGKGQKC